MKSDRVMGFLKWTSQAMRLFISLALLLAGFTASAETSSTPENNDPLANTFVALCYHDVSNGFVGNAFSIRKKDLVEQFDYLKAHYNVVGLQDILEASQGKKTLPAKAVLITVDDGLASFYENVFPLLKTYKFKAVFAIVGKWTEDGVAPDYGFKDTNPKMASWKQLKEMSESGWVDVVSHTYDMHQGHVFNPQGSQAPVAGFFRYDSITKSYQSEEDLVNRVQTDLKKNNELIKKHLGKENSVVVWPYGASNGLSRKAAEDVGLKIQMTLRAGLNNANDISQIGRGLIFADMDLPQFASALEQAFVDSSPLRMIRIDLDSIWKKNEAEAEQVLGDLLEKTLSLGANAALFQAVSESGDAYFPTSQMHVRADYLNRTAHTMRHRSRVPNVYARVPQAFLRNTETAKAVIRDLAKYTDIDGVFFEVSSKEKAKELSFEPVMAAGRSVRPHWQYGVIGPRPENAEIFDYLVLTPQQLEKEKLAAVPNSIKQKQDIIALPKDYNIVASHVMAEGYLNLFYDVNFKDVVPDPDFKTLFSVRQSNAKHIKGEAK
ncbi:hypothetical protein AZI85_17190 [Bdellovibrio bacteriovorus]|uniref:NodB homology domain-containing protein n=1 Tax=Bdellovibrio bacteriovorus TaxID=959 RepID=A0A150WTJ1_BDEBC|nr:poly-beta-1,6-N-acetyl-D-glucosamine N-deacetylase PgaB [Bdellovibrio bacteriovorus]KYG67614.1 hypothetical protein AZI85_17190 [Bdellovibrio bacteriovorus]